MNGPYLGQFLGHILTRITQIHYNKKLKTINSLKAIVLKSLFRIISENYTMTQVGKSGLDKYKFPNWINTNLSLIKLQRKS